MVYISLSLYRAFFWLTSFFWIFFLFYRVRRGKESPTRWRERIGKTRLLRSPQKRIWINAVSVGEALAIIPLLERLPEIYPPHQSDIRILLTTSTLSSAEIIKDKLPAHVFHQFIVLDHPLYVRRFLSHWRPALAIWVESELWPNMILYAAKRKIPLALINARLSPRTIKNWNYVKPLAQFLLSKFDLCLAQNEANAYALQKLGARHVCASGNLKYDIPPLAVDENALSFWRDLLGERKVFLAASTHEGEEEVIIKTYQAALAQGLEVVLMIAPRHPPRGAAIAEKIKALGFSMMQHSREPAPKALPDIYIIDQLGQLGLFYRLAHIVFMGGSLIKHGGQNPLEPARLNCALMSGEHVFNFTEIYDHLSAFGGVACLRQEKLSSHLIDLLKDGTKIQAIAERAKTASDQLKGALDNTLLQLKPLMKRL